MQVNEVVGSPVEEIRQILEGALETASSLKDTVEGLPATILEVHPLSPCPTLRMFCWALLLKHLLSSMPARDRCSPHVWWAQELQSLPGKLNLDQLAGAVPKEIMAIMETIK